MKKKFTFEKKELANIDKTKFHNKRGFFHSLLKRIFCQVYGKNKYTNKRELKFFFFLITLLH